MRWGGGGCCGVEEEAVPVQADPASYQPHRKRHCCFDKDTTGNLTTTFLYAESTTT